jgi:RNA polymerase sigma-70 factor (ECF subfamily)
VALYQRHLKQIYVYHLSHTGNEQDAQDLTSETFLAMVDSINHYHPAYTFSAWLFGIARHKLADYFNQKTPENSLEEVNDPPTTESLPEQLTMQHFDTERVYEVLRLLSPDRADALRLRFLCNLSLSEVAQVMDKNEAAVKMLIYRGLEEMRGRLGTTILEEV